MISYAAIDASANELEHACRAVVASLLAGRRRLSLEAMRHQVKELASGLHATAPEVMAFAQALRHLENAEEAMILLFGANPGLSLLPPLSHVGPRGRAIAAIRAQLSLRSAVFRHALRVAVASAAATAITLWLDLPHGIWLPMTTLVVLQPEFGGTFARALERTAGTAAGAAIAGGSSSEPAGEIVRCEIGPLLGFAGFLGLRPWSALVDLDGRKAAFGDA